MQRENVAVALAGLALVVAAASPAIASSLITGKQIAHHTIHKINLASDAMPKQGKVGRAGAQGPAGPAGAQGPAGGFDPSKVAVVQNSAVVAADGQQTITASCASGAKVIGGGFNGGGTAVTFNSQPTSDGTGWAVGVLNISDTASVTASVYAICASS